MTSAGLFRRGARRGLSVAGAVGADVKCGCRIVSNSSAAPRPAAPTTAAASSSHPLPDAASALSDPAPAPARAPRPVRRLSARRRPVRHRRAPGRRQGPRLRAPDRRAAGARGRARHVGARDDRPRVQHSRDRRAHRRHALPGACDRIEPTYAKLDRRESRAGLPQASPRRHGRRPGLHARHRAPGGAADGRGADVREPAARGRRGRQAVPARPLPCAGDDERHRSPVLSEVVPGRHSHFRRRSPREDPRIPGQGDLPPLRHGDAARHSRVHRRRGRGRGRLARRRRVGRQGADPCRRPRQGRRRQGRALAGRGARAGGPDPRHAARHAPDRPGGPEGAPAADRGRRRHQAGALRRDDRRPRDAARVPDGELGRRHGHRGGGGRDAGEDPPRLHRSGNGPHRRRGRRHGAQDRHSRGERARRAARC